MQAFDFSNYTYSGLLSILATLFGMAYPLIIDCISKIDDKYDSTVLMARFLEEVRYRLFILLLAINVAVGIGLPFVLSITDKNNNDLLLLVQMGLMVALVAQTFVLIRLILTYYNANTLCEHLEGKQTRDWSRIKSNVPYVRALYDVARYAARKSDRALYVKSCSALYSIIYILQEKTNTDQSKMPTVVEYPDEVKAILNDFCDFVRYNKNTYPFVRNEVDVLSSLISTITPSLISPWEYSYIWRNLYYAAQDGDEEWFINKYWIWIDQFYRFQIDSKAWAYRKEGKPVVNEYKLHASMACAMMLRMKHYKIVEDAVFFSHSTVKPYPLVPNTFSEVFEQGRLLYDLKFGLMNITQLSSRFMMPDIYCGVNSDSVIYKEGVRYLALMMIRLFSVNDYNITFSHPLSEPSYRTKINDLKADRQLAEDLRVAVIEWYAKNVFELFTRFTKCKQSDVKGLLWKYQNECDRIIGIKEKDFKPSKRKLNAYLKHMKDIEEKLVNWLPQLCDCVLDDDQRIEKHGNRSLSAAIPMDCMTEWKDMDLETVPEHTCDFLKEQVERVYMSILKDSITSGTLSIKKENLFKKLKKDWLSLDYVCVATGSVISGLLSETSIKGLGKDGCGRKCKGLKGVESYEGEQWGYIIRRQDLPFVTFNGVPDNQQWGDLGIFFSNLKDLADNTQAEYNVNTTIDFTINRKINKVNVVEINIV